MIVIGDGGDNVLVGTRESDGLDGRGGNDVLRGGRGADDLDGGAGADFMVGGIGEDTYWVDDVGDRVREHLDEGFADLVYSTAAIFRLSPHVENMILRGRGDIAGLGNDLDNRIVGNAGDNRIGGGIGADRLEGRDGDDLYLTDADDTIVEAVDGGIDTARVSLRTADYQMQANVENAIIDGGTFRLYGNALDNVVRGSEEPDYVVGGLGDDRLRGGGGDDFLEGSEGDDVLIGGPGQDVVIGRAGADKFLFRDGDFSDPAVPDVIAFFQSTEGDRINLRAVDANTGLAGDQQFTFIGTQAFTGTAGELRFSGILVEGDVNGDGSADFAIRVSGATLDRHDFIL